MVQLPGFDRPRASWLCVFFVFHCNQSVMRYTRSNTELKKKWAWKNLD